MVSGGGKAAQGGMMKRDLDHWLWIATKGLAPQIAARVREEITAHYEAELERQLDDGADDLHAHRLALEALGDPEAVARGMIEPHRSRTYYQLAALGSLSIPLLLTLMTTQNFQLVFYFGFAFNGILSSVDWMLLALYCGTAGYILLALRRAFVQRFELRQANWALRLIMIGTVGIIVFLAAQHLLVEFAHGTWSAVASTLDPELAYRQPFANVMYLIFALSIPTLGSGLLGFARTIGQIRGRLGTLYRPLQLSAISAGSAMLIWSLLLLWITGNPILAQSGTLGDLLSGEVLYRLVMLMVGITHCILYGLFAALFARIALWYGKSKSIREWA
jgi:hypothetical protein